MFGPFWELNVQDEQSSRCKAQDERRARAETRRGQCHRALGGVVVVEFHPKYNEKPL